MKFVRYTWLIAPFAFWLAPIVSRSKSLTAFLPEVDSYFRLSSKVRSLFDAKGYMEDGDFNHAQIGPSLQFNLRPFEKLQQIAIFDLDDTKCMPVVFTIGYRYLPSSAQPSINRMQPIVQCHVPFPGRTLVTDRNRFDLDWSHGDFFWTYRNRIIAERRLTIRSYHPGPYAAAEFGYQSQFSKWSNTRLFAGCLWPLTTHIQLDTYYEHVNNSARRPTSINPA